VAGGCGAAGGVWNGPVASAWRCLVGWAESGWCGWGGLLAGVAGVLNW